MISSRELLTWQQLVDSVTIHRDVISYIVACVRQTRYDPEVHTGASPRTGIKLSRLARALSLIRGENFVTIDTVKEIFYPAVSHRVIMKDPSQDTADLLAEVLKSVPVEPPLKKRNSKKP